MLLVLERSVVREFRLARTRPDRGPELDVALQAYVNYLHILGCPPEHVVLHIKRRFDDAAMGSGTATDQQVQEAIILRAIKVYFGAH